MTSSSTDRLVESYLDLRMALGLLGFLLPPLLLAVAQELLPSMSDYYASDSRDILVGVLFAIAAFLAAYRGYERLDDVAGDIGAVSAVVVAVCPNTSTSITSRYVHVGAAALVFLVFAFFCLFLFTKGSPSAAPTRKKEQRNVLYRVCGGVIVVGLLTIVIFAEPTQPKRESYLVLVVEWIMLWAFALAWMVKGKAFLNDEGEGPIRTVGQAKP